jgi:hypothetical protein
MGIINTGSFAKDLWPGVNSWYGIKYKEYPVEHLDIFDKHTSDQAFEEDVGAAMFGLAPVKAEGTSITYDDAEQAFIDRYTHVTYALNVAHVKPFLIDLEVPGGTTGRKQAQAVQRERLSGKALKSDATVWTSV